MARLSPVTKKALQLLVATSIIFGVLYGLITEDFVAGLTAFLLACVLGPVAIVVVWALMLAPILFHEVGHVVFGRMARFTFHSMQIGPFLIKKLHDRFRILSTGKVTATGAALMSPDSAERLLPRFRWTIIGGPVFSLGWHAGLMIALSASDRSPWFPIFDIASGALYQDYFWFVLWIFSLVALSGSIVPYRYRGARTDAMLLLDIARRDQGEAIAIQLVLGRLAVAGERPRDWPEEAAKRLRVLHEQKRADEFAGYLVYCWLDDLDEKHDAYELLSKLVDKLSKQGSLSADFRDIVRFEHVWHLATTKKDCDRAADELSKLEDRKNSVPYVYHRAWLALHACRGEMTEARNHAVAAAKAPRDHHKSRNAAVDAALEEMQALAGEDCEDLRAVFQNG